MKNQYPSFRLNPVGRIIFIDAQGVEVIENVHHLQTADKVIISVSPSNEIIGVWLLDVPLEVVKIGLVKALT